jgi:hypothetical protein
MPESCPGNPRKRVRLLEDAFIILCILTLWPTVLKWRHPAFQYLMYVALAGLLVILFRRIRRLTGDRDESAR